ncbi:MAG: hypothetical protein JST42_19995, partial [Bacteroidetes bacterium]|nr:hypothetical protein [Bacteroidota bacterium]
MFLAQEEEREHIGEELHDNINQLLATARLCLMAGQEEVETSTAVVRKGVDYLDKAIVAIRQLSKRLVMREIIQTGLVNSIKDLMETINMTKRLELELEVSDHLEEGLKEDEKIAIYRIIQEQLSNIFRHSRASRARIQLMKADHKIDLRIEDNGKGFNPRQTTKGIGITNIINRAKLLDGEVAIDTGPD